MSELNENVEVTIDDATVVTVPLVENFTATNAAPTAKFVGDALAEKVDTDGIMEAVRITFNGIESDNQGVILASGDDIPVEDGSATTIKAAIDAVGAKTAADIAYGIGGTIQTKIEAVEGEISAAVSAIEGEMYADQIPMGASDTTKVAAAIGAVDTRLQAVEGKYLKKETQTLTDEEKSFVRSNLGLASVSPVVISELTSDPISLSAGGLASNVLISVPEVAGYTPVGIVGRSMSGTGISYINVYRMTMINDDESGTAQIQIYARNTGSDAISGATISCMVMYIKNTFVAVSAIAAEET